MAFKKRTFDELDRLVQLEEAHKDALRKDLDELLERKAQYRREAQAAAEAGDVAGYTAKHEAERLTDTEIFVKRTQLDKAGAALPLEDVMSAWDDYAKTHADKLSKEWKSFQTERKALYDHFMRIVLMQNTALKERERCARLAGEENPSKFKLATVDAHNVPGLNFGRRTLTMPETIYFLSCGEATETDGEMFNTVLRVLQPV